MSCDVETLAISPRGWHWADHPELTAPDDLQLLKTVPVTDHLLVWHQVIRPPWDAIRNLQGKANAGTFLGCPEATVHFRGATANKLFRSTFEAGASDFCWEISYAFRERAIKFDGHVYGWNHSYRDDPPGWAELDPRVGPPVRSGGPIGSLSTSGNVNGSIVAAIYSVLRFVGAAAASVSFSYITSMIPRISSAWPVSRRMASCSRVCRLRFMISTAASAPSTVSGPPVPKRLLSSS